VNAHNESIAFVLNMLFGDSAFLAGGALLGATLGVVFLVVHDPMRSAYLVHGTALLLLSTLNSWYLALIIPFQVFFPSRGWLYLQAVTVPAVLWQHHTALFYDSGVLKLLEYGPFFGFLVWDTFRDKRVFSGTRFREVKKLSVVMPVLNESKTIRSALEALKREKTSPEIIVVDGGSDDGTREIAAGLGVQVMKAPKGRGLQIKAGIDRSTGDAVMILHADCLIRQGVTGRVMEELNGNPRAIGGCLGMSYFDPSLKNGLIARVNNARAIWTGISFGDQGQFFRREALPLMGGFPEVMLMEDVELSMRLKEQGSLCFVPRGVTVSKRRWGNVGFLANIGRVVCNCVVYLVRRRLGIGDSSGGDLYGRYYGTN
jgi:rSAM/selenodomain-associated transferase 2